MGLWNAKGYADEMSAIIQQKIETDPNYCDPRLIAFPTMCKVLP